jgi:hypothetical protein
MNGKPTRRAFFFGAGAALAAPVAATAALGARGEGLSHPAALAAALDDSNAIRVLLARFMRLKSARRHAELRQLFADPARAHIDPDVRRLAADEDANVALTADGTATAHVVCTVETTTPIESCGTLVEMARAQGEGFVVRSERRVLRGTFVKRTGVWKISTMELVA